MSIGWITEDIAELTGAVIGAWDFPVNIIRKKPTAFHNSFVSSQQIIRHTSSSSLMHTYSMLTAERASKEYMTRIEALANEVALRIQDCRACQMPLLIMSLDHGISSNTIHYVIGQAEQYFQDRKDALYHLQQTLCTADDIKPVDVSSYNPAKNDISDSLAEMIYKNTVVRLVTSSTITDRFWRIEDDFKKINEILSLQNSNVVDLLESAGGLHKSYVKCENCGQLLYSTSTGKLFPYCARCYERKED